MRCAPRLCPHRGSQARTATSTAACATCARRRRRRACAHKPNNTTKVAGRPAAGRERKVLWGALCVEEKRGSRCLGARASKICCAERGCARPAARPRRTAGLVALALGVVWWLGMGGRRRMMSQLSGTPSSKRFTHMIIDMSS